ncbi:MAG: hypothetical protein ACEQSR_10345 [Candidatus Methylacidiphilales bacterium]
MAKIININTTQTPNNYNEQLGKLGVFINETIGELDGYAINLACEGVWKDWNKEQKLGAEMAFELENIYEINDPNIQKIYELKSKLMETITRLSQQ